MLVDALRSASAGKLAKSDGHAASRSIRYDTLRRAEADGPLGHTHRHRAHTTRGWSPTKLRTKRRWIMKAINVAVRRSLQQKFAATYSDLCEQFLVPDSRLGRNSDEGCQWSRAGLTSSWQTAPASEIDLQRPHGSCKLKRH